MDELKLSFGINVPFWSLSLKTIRHLSIKIWSPSLKGNTTSVDPYPEVISGYNWISVFTNSKVTWFSTTSISSILYPLEFCIGAILSGPDKSSVFSIIFTSTTELPWIIACNLILSFPITFNVGALL